VCEHTGVVEELLAIDGRLGDILKAHHEKLENTTMVGRKQLS
jgi:hypothetical protein